MKAEDIVVAIESMDNAERIRTLLLLNDTYFYRDPDELSLIIDRVKDDSNRPLPRRKKVELIVTDDISHTGLTEEEYRIVEDHVDPSLNKQELFDEFEKHFRTIKPRLLKEVGVIAYLKDGWIVHEYRNGRIEKIKEVDKDG